MKKQISAVLVASVIATNTSPAINVFADEVIKEKSKILEKKSINQANVTKFTISDNKNFEAYNEKFRVSRDERKSTSNNGGKYGSSTLDKAIDGNMSTHWETGNQNSEDFKNEVVVEFNDAQSIDRIAYATRQDGSKGKGFPTKFEIYSSITGNDEDFELVATGAHSQTGNMMEFKFDTITTKKVKFVFKEAHNNWASASEFWFYKEDKMIDTLNNLFTDSTMSKVSELFNTTEKLNKLEDEAKKHPFYEDFKEDIENAKILLASNKIESTKAKVSKLTAYGTDKEKEYDAKYMMPNSNISNIEANGGTYPTTKLEYMLDGKANTHWETNRSNSADFTNELIFTLEEAEVLDRIAFLAREGNQKGFPEQFEIYASETSKGDTFQLVSSGEAKVTRDFVQFKFEPTKFKRVKFKFKKAATNRPFAAEMRFYKQDEISEKMDRLFTDSTMSKVSEEFNTLDKISAFENELKSHPMYDIYKEDMDNAKLLVENKQVEYTEAKISKFSEIDSENISKYNEEFKVGVSKVSNNGRQSSGKTIDRAFDGDINTEWLTGTLNSATFDNEVLVELDELTTLDRIVYSNTRGTNRGFAQEFEIYGSRTSKGETFELVTKGSMDPTQDSMEIKFNPTEFKRLKFVYKKGVENWACASEFGLYKPDELSNKVDRLFTDSNMNIVSDEFNSLEKIEALEKELKEHPMYDIYKEDIENAKTLITQNKIESSIASTKKVDYYDNEKYSELFRMPLSNIKSIKNNAGRYANQVITNAADGKLNTYWETNKSNNDSFNNEVEVEFKESVTLNRVVYGARQSDRKGFAQEFEIYGSKTSKGDTYELVATGNHSKTSGQVEAKFNPTEFKRLKFKFVKSDQNWATLNEISFYKQDDIYEKVNSIFTSKLMTELKDEFNSKDAIDELANEINNHPLKDELDHLIERAYRIINNDIESVKMTVPQLGDIHGHAKKDLSMASFGTNLISTGLVATPGEVFEIYVDAEDGQPMPKIAFTQSQGYYGKWKQEFSLSPGYNKITVPNIYDSNWTHKTNPGGAVYIINPYTEETQGKAPVVSIEGGRKFPVYNEGDDVNEFLEELKEYKRFMDENPDTAVNIFEYNSPRILYTGLADAAYQVYVNEGVNVEESAKVWSDMTQKMFDFAGLEDNPEVKEHDSTNLRTTIRIMQPFAAAYAAGDHIGLQRHVADDFLRTDKNSVNGIIWGTIHEIGHQMDIRPRTWGEVTNNMWANRLSIDNGKADNRVNYSGIYNNGATDKEDFEGFYDFDVTRKLSMFWQLESYHAGYWASLERLYRERKPSPKDEQEKRDILAKYSSEILGKDLTEYFTRYKFDLSEECKNEIAKFEKTTDKIWYGNTSVQTYKGSGFTDDLDLQVNTSIDKENRTVTLNISVDKENEDDKLGYEILKDGKVIGYTTGNQFVIENANVDSNEIYQVKAYDRSFGHSDALDVNTFKPSIETIDNVTLKLGEEFNAKDYVKALSYDGQILDSVEIEHNVNTNEKGIYTVTYSVTDEGIKVSKDIEVEVVSDYDYLSDEEWKSVETQWGTPRRNSNIKARVNGDVKEFEKGLGIHANGKITYDLSDKDYDRFEALLGVDASIAPQNKSSITFKIVGDGKTLATTKVLKHADDAAYVNVDVKGVKELVIEIHNGGNGNELDHAVIANPKLITNNAKAKITAKDKTYKLGEEVDFMSGVKAIDAEDGDLTSKVEIASTNYVEGKIGRFEVVYRVTDSDNNVVEKKSYVTIYEDFVVNKSKFGQFDNLNKYNEEFKLKVSSVSNNAGNYPGSPIGNAIDGNPNTHWETNKPNSDTFKNEVIFDLGESKEISKIAYKPRNGGKGFAKKFEIYTSNEAEGNDFILAGKGEYNGNVNDVVEFNISKTTARRVMFKFVEANQNWASIGEMSFYKEDALADKIANNLFTDSTKTEVTEAYNTLDELEALREEVKNHPAAKLFEEDLNKAEQIIKAKYPTLKVENTVHNLEEKVNVLDGVTAIDKDGTDITSQIKIKSSDYKEGRLGKFTVVYTVTDSAGLTSEITRDIFVTNEEIQLSSLDWKSATIGSGSVRKNKAVSGNALRLLDKNGNVETFEKGIGTHSHSEIVYNSEGYDVLDTWVGVDQTVAGKDPVIAGKAGTVEFSVYVDGKKVASSGLMKADTPKKRMIVDVAGSNEVKLVVEQATNGNSWDHANWADAKFHKMSDMERINLEATLEEAEKLDLNNYSDETIKVLEEAIAKAKEALESGNQELINSATQELKNAMDSLVEVNLNEVVNIPDKYLVKSIQKQLNKTGDITLGDMRSLTTLTLDGVEDLTGLEYARNLETLSMDYNEVKDLRPLANLNKLNNLSAREQFIAGGELNSSNGKVVVDSKIYNKEGKNVAKTVRLVDKFGATVIEKDAEEEFVIDTKDLKEGTYGVHVLFEDEGFNGIVFYLFSI